MLEKYVNYNLFMFDGEGSADGVATGTETAESEPQVAGEDRSKAFEELIKGEYKEEYDKRVKETLNKRFKANKDNEAELGRYAKLAELLSQKYGTTDPDELYSTINDDDGFYEQLAYDAGMDVDQYRKMQQLSMENEKYRRERAEQEEEAEIDALYSEWVDQAEALREVFPNIDLEEECENETFVALLTNGLTVEQAYKAIHQDEIIESMMAEAAKHAKQETVNNVLAKGTRPAENGLRARAGSDSRIDPSAMTYEQIDEYIKRAKRGESISF